MDAGVQIAKMTLLNSTSLDAFKSIFLNRWGHSNWANKYAFTLKEKNPAPFFQSAKNIDLAHLSLSTIERPSSAK